MLACQAPADIVRQAGQQLALVGEPDSCGIGGNDAIEGRRRVAEVLHQPILHGPLPGYVCQQGIASAGKPAWQRIGHAAHDQHR